MTSRHSDSKPAEDPARTQETRPALIVGFGNPGTEYAATRHNVGAWCVRELAHRMHANFARHGRVETATTSIDSFVVHLARPRTFVNESGGPIAAELRRLNLEPHQLLVVYDELDLPVGQVRVRLQGGHGGHNGMRSLIAAIGQDFPRVRVGIDRPYDDGRPVRDPDRIAAWVLAPPSRVERVLLDAAVRQAADAITFSVGAGVELAMNRFNPSS